MREKRKKKGVVGAIFSKKNTTKTNTRVLKNTCHSLVEIVYRRLLGVPASLHLMIRSPKKFVSRFVGRIS